MLGDCTDGCSTLPDFNDWMAELLVGHKKREMDMYNVMVMYGMEGKVQEPSGRRSIELKMEETSR